MFFMSEQCDGVYACSAMSLLQSKRLEQEQYIKVKMDEICMLIEVPAVETLVHTRL